MVTNVREKLQNTKCYTASPVVYHYKFEVNEISTLELAHTHTHIYTHIKTKTNYISLLACALN